MSDVASSTTAELLQYLHEGLDSHFIAMREARTSLEPSSPVFALEHDLSEEDLDLLMTTVRAAVPSGLGLGTGNGGLPFVVHAAEVGYTTTALSTGRSTPRRPRVGPTASTSVAASVVFEVRAGVRRGVPQGAWADTFRKIAWPITHAVLPRYLQVQLAKMLSDYRRVAEVAR